MARKYAINGLPGLKGGVVTSVDGEIISPGEELPEGATTFSLTYWYFPTPADIQAGAVAGKRTRVAIEDLPISLSNADVRNEIMRARASVRASKSWGYPQAFAYSTV